MKRSAMDWSVRSGCEGKQGHYDHEPCDDPEGNPHRVVDPFSGEEQGPEVHR